MIRDFHSSTKWISGKILERSGPVSYKIKLQDGSIIRRHVDHIRAYSPEPEPRATPREVSPPEFEFVDGPSDQPEDDMNTETSTNRYPQRNRHPPERLMNLQI